MKQIFFALLVKLIILFSRCLTPTKGLTVTQRIITKAIIENFEIKHCILVSEGENKTASFKDHKIMSTWNVLTNVKSPAEFYFYINTYLYPMISPNFPGTNDASWEKSKKLLMPKTLIILQNYTLSDLSTLFFTYKNGQTAGYFTWIAFIKKSEHLTTSLHIKVPYNAEFIAIKEINTTAYELIETYKIREAQFVSHFGFWTMQKGLQTSSLSFNERRIDMNNTVLYSLSRSMNYDKILYMYHMEIAKDFGKMMNTRIEMVNTQQPGGLTITNILFAMNHALYVKDGIGPILKVNSYLYIKEPKITGSSTYFMLPFHRNLWLSLFCVLVLGSFLFIVLYLMQNQQLKKEKIELVDFGFKLFETFCNQNGSKEAKPFSIGSLIFTMRLLVIIMFSAYSAVLWSRLIIRISHAPFESLEELMKAGLYTVGCTQGGYEDLYFMLNPPGSLYRNIYETMLRKKITNNDTIEINRVCQGNHAHMSPEHTIRSLENINCRLFQIKNPVSTRLTTYQFNVHSHGITSAFSYKLHWFYSSGIIHRIQNELKSWRAKKALNNFLPVEIDHIFYLVSILTIGIFFSISLFILELLFKFTIYREIVTY